MIAIFPALNAMQKKLQKYYSLTDGPDVYANALILNPRWKSTLFRQRSWESHMEKDYKEACREEFMSHYNDFDTPEELMESPKQTGQKRSYNEMEDDEEDIRQFAEMIGSSRQDNSQNQYDRYIREPCIETNQSSLSYWRSQASGGEFSKLSRMIRDYFAVPPTSAGIERQFSHSGFVVIPLRNRLISTTISDIMMYKNHLFHQGKPLND